MVWRKIDSMGESRYNVSKVDVKDYGILIMDLMKWGCVKKRKNHK